MYNEQAIDNALMGIKDELMTPATHLNREADTMPVIREEIETLNDIASKLELLRPLWKALRYSYKGREIASHLETAARQWMLTMGDSGKCHNAALLTRTWERCNNLVVAYHADETQLKAA